MNAKARINVFYKDFLLIAQVFSKLSLYKIFNSLLVYCSFYFSKITGRSRILGWPIAMSVEPTTSCNLRCPECPSGLRSFTRPTGMLQKENFYRLIDQVKDHLVYLIFYFQGEPFLNTSFLEMVKFASQKGIYTSTSTNGHYLTKEVARKTVESGLDKLIVSIDGTTQEVYEQYRVGGNLQKVLEGVEHLVTQKKELKSATPFVILQFLVVRPNEHQIQEAERLKETIGADKIVFKTAQIYDYQNGSPLIPEQEKYSRYKKLRDGSYILKNKLLNECWKMWHSCVVTWDGKIVPCCFDKDASHTLGNIFKHNFREIWRGSSYKDFRSTLMKSRSKIEICKNCTEGTKVFETI